MPAIWDTGIGEPKVKFTRAPVTTADSEEGVLPGEVRNVAERVRPRQAAAICRTLKVRKGRRPTRP